MLRLSAWGARALHGLNYRFPLRVNWLPAMNWEQIARELDARRRSRPARFAVNLSFARLPARVSGTDCFGGGHPRDTRLASLTRAQARALAAVDGSEFLVTGKSLNRDEFVTCGGVRLAEVNFQTMESRACAGLFFAGELLDVDGVTGGFNFQAAWTTGFIAGQGGGGLRSREYAGLQEERRATEPVQTKQGAPPGLPNFDQSALISTAIFS